MASKKPGHHKTEKNAKDLIFGNSQMAGLIRAHDWSLTALGRLEEWPESLLGSANMMLGCAFPSLVFWGPELVQLYNDAFVPLLAERHPSGLGQTAAHCWSDAWQIVGPNLKRVIQDRKTGLLRKRSCPDRSRWKIARHRLDLQLQPNFWVRRRGSGSAGNLPGHYP